VKILQDQLEEERRLRMDLEARMSAELRPSGRFLLTCRALAPQRVLLCQLRCFLHLDHHLHLLICFLLL
jgi:hypothetical protein